MKTRGNTLNESMHFCSRSPKKMFTKQLNSVKRSVNRGGLGEAHLDISICHKLSVSLRCAYVFAIHNSLFAVHTKPKNQNFKYPITDVRVSGLPEIIISGPKWVHMARHGLILCQDGALPLPIISIHLPGPKTD